MQKVCDGAQSFLFANENLHVKILIANLQKSSDMEKTMKKKFKCEVDCAACAVKMEDAIKKIPGVSDASINFMTQKLMLEASDDQFDSIVLQAVKACKKLSPTAKLKSKNKKTVTCLSGNDRMGTYVKKTKENEKQNSGCPASFLSPAYYR